MDALLLFFQDGYFGEIFLAEKNCWTQKVHLAITFWKIPLDVCMGVCVYVYVCVCGCMYSAIAEKNQIVHSKENASNQM